MDRTITLRIVSSAQPGSRCRRAWCATPGEGAWLVEDNTHTRRTLCPRCYAALVEICQRTPQAVAAVA